MLVLNFAILTNPIISHAETDVQYNCRSYVLMDMASKSVLEESSSHSRYPIASMTKLMTILLTLENIESGDITLDDKVLISENAFGMGGSQIFLDKNEEYPLGELLKSVIVASANDSSVALAEYISGSERNFVEDMNRRAIELNMQDTNYANCTGLPSNDGYSSAYDQALLLGEVLQYDTYRQLSSVWLEDFVHPSGRTTQMTNTNKLSKFYPGCIGGKTGSTNEAKYCLAVGAERNNTGLIAVVIGADNSKLRFNIASELLNTGFANYETVTILSNKNVENTKIAIKGLDQYATVHIDHEYSKIIKKGSPINFSLSFNLPDSLKSVTAGEAVGSVDVILDGQVVDTVTLIANETIDEASVWDYFKAITN